jgi:hypothetical protein
MQNAAGTVHREFQIGYAARAKVKLHASRLIDWAITKNPYVAFQQIAVALKHLRQMR